MNRKLLFSTLIVPLACVVGCHAASPLQFFRGPTSDAAVESLTANDPDHLESPAPAAAISTSAASETPPLQSQLLISDLLPLPVEPLPNPPSDPPPAATAADASMSDDSRSWTHQNSESGAAPAADVPTSDAPAASSERPAVSQATAMASSESASLPFDGAPPKGGEAAAASGLTAIAQRTFDALRLNLYPSSPGEPSVLSNEIAQFERFPFAFDLATVAGERVSSASFGGQLMIIDVWATWCGPCRRAIPDFVEIQKEYEAKGVQVIGITCDSDDPADAADTARKAYNIGEQLSINYPLLVDDGTTTKQIPGFRGYPTTLFMTPDGVVRYKVTGVQSKARLAAMIEAILQQ